MSIKKLYWNIATVIYLHVAYVCFFITAVELSSSDKPVRPTMLKILTICLLQKKKNQKQKLAALDHHCQ